MEKRILDALEKAGWHLKPAIVADTIRDIEEDDGEEGGAHRILTERELEAKVRRELLDTDLSYSGARFLASQQRILPTPCVLQVVSIQDVSQSKSNQGSSSPGRLLHVRLTDGHSFVKAIEHRHVPSLSLDIAPGTKVTLQGSVTLQGDMILLDPNSIRIEGGHVAALHEAWEMQRKYAGALSRSTADGSSGPPPFRGLNTTTRGAQAAASKPTGDVKPTQDMREQAGPSSSRPTQDMRAASKQDVRAAATTSAEAGAHVRQPPSRMRPGAEPYRPRGRQQSEGNTQSEAPSVATSLAEVALEKPPTVTAPPTPSPQSSEPEPKAEGRVREKAPEVAPVQNRQAAQKLLDRRTDAGVGAERGRGRGRGPRRGRYDDDEHDERVMTLDEWEAKRSTAPTSSNHAAAAISDEELAMRLQEQFNMENSHDVKPKQLSAAEQLRQSMFSYVPEQSSVESSRGRSRGRGRGGRGRGRR